MPVDDEVEEFYKTYGEQFYDFEDWGDMEQFLTVAYYWRGHNMLEQDMAVMDEPIYPDTTMCEPDM